jgi:uncharacterized iron-regulated membrane protein
MRLTAPHLVRTLSMLRSAARTLHLWLGLITGLIIAIVCITGTLLTFREESDLWLYPELTLVEPGAARMSLDALVEASGLESPAITLYDDPRRSVELSAKKRTVRYIDPYTGKILGDRVYLETPMGKVFSLHRWLLMPDGPGGLIVGTSTLIFLFIILTGYIIWFPRNRRTLRDRLRITWSKGALRALRELHIAAGFYVGAILFVIALAALPWSFKWADAGVYAVTSSPRESSKPSAITEQGRVQPLDVLLATATQAAGPWHTAKISPPKEPGQALVAQLLLKDAQHNKAQDKVELNPVTGALISHTPFAARPPGVRARAHLYALHIGSILGWPTRLIAFVATLLGATFPITGFLMWFVAWRAKRRAAVRRDASVATTEPEGEATDA